MENPNHPGQATNMESDADKLVCSPEFSGGCPDPIKGKPPKLAPCAPIPEVQPRPEPVAAAPSEEPEPVLTHNASDEPEPGFPEIACSAEFPKGCVNPADESA